MCALIAALLLAAVAHGQSIETTTSAPRNVTLRVIAIETDVENPWDRWWSRRASFELADAEFELAVLRDRRPADQADRERIRTRMREVAGQISRLRALVASSERQIRREQVVIRGWDGVEARQTTVIAERSRAEDAARLTVGDLVDLTIEAVTRSIPHPNPRTDLEKHARTRVTEQAVRSIRPRTDPPPDWREPRDPNQMRYPAVPLAPERVAARVEERRSSVQRPYLFLQVGDGIMNPVRWARVRAFVRNSDGDDVEELTPPEGLLVETPRVESPSGQTVLRAEMSVGWPIELADHIRIEVVEAWRYRGP